MARVSQHRMIGRACGADRVLLCRKKPAAWTTPCPKGKLRHPITRRCRKESRFAMNDKRRLKREQRAWGRGVFRESSNSSSASRSSSLQSPQRQFPAPTLTEQPSSRASSRSATSPRSTTPARGSTPPRAPTPRGSTPPRASTPRYSPPRDATPPRATPAKRNRASSSGSLPPAKRKRSLSSSSRSSPVKRKRSSSSGGSSQGRKSVQKKRKTTRTKWPAHKGPLHAKRVRQRKNYKI